MRYAWIAIMLAAACDPDTGRMPQIDASGSAQQDAARLVDAPVQPPADAAADASNSAITAACMALCDALAVCFMEPTADPGCYTDCAADLQDCTPQQVQTLDACKTEACGTDENGPIFVCIAGVACVQG
jgi:hypothetical protein